MTRRKQKKALERHKLLYTYSTNLYFSNNFLVIHFSQTFHVLFAYCITEVWNPYVYNVTEMFHDNKTKHE